MEIVLYPHPALRWKAKPVTQIDADLRKTVRRMFELMYESNGIGLAGPQVGLPYRVFVVNLTADPEEKDEEHVFINPEITRRRGSDEAEEGCLSLPRLYAPVRRPEQVVVEAFDLSGRELRFDVDDLAARAVQHEIDHLDGVLFIDRLSDAARREIQPVLDEFESHFRREQDAGRHLSDDLLKQRLAELEPK